MDEKTSSLTDLRSAILFITILPAGKNVAYSPMGMIRFFPVVGLIIGALLVLFNTLSVLVSALLVLVRGLASAC